jgi:1-deoxy-D-xylulose 5-phosphate reductoisomerase
MSLVNVEKIEAQEKHEKSWFKRFKNKTLSVAATGTALVMGTSANAADEFTVPDFIMPVKSAFTSIATDLGGFFMIVLGITVAIAIFVISRGGIKKGASS